MSVLTENNSGSQPDQDDLISWVEEAGMSTIPALQNDDDYAPWIDYEQDWYIPTTVVLGPDMAILSLDEGVLDPGPYMD